MIVIKSCVILHGSELPGLTFEFCYPLPDAKNRLLKILEDRHKIYQLDFADDVPALVIRIYERFSTPIFKQVTFSGLKAELTFLKKLADLYLARELKLN